MACTYGHLEIAKWLLSIKSDINISSKKESFDNEKAFQGACSHSYLEVAKWLLSVKPDIDISRAFTDACKI